MLSGHVALPLFTKNCATKFYAVRILLAPLIAQVGFPASVILALWITFNESIGALFLGCGLFTRVLAASAALGMAGALYTSVRLGEDWLRAALYLIVFIQSQPSRNFDASLGLFTSQDGSAYISKSRFKREQPLDSNPGETAT